MSIPDHYATLGVATTARRGQVRAARDRCLERHPPDVPVGDADEARRVRIAILLAGEVLRDPAARDAYDDALACSRDLPGHDSPRRRPARVGSPDIACLACDRLNVPAKRGYCIFSGAGIGPTPHPITPRHLLLGSIRENGVVNAGCGVLVGLVIGAVMVMRTVTPDISGTGACILIAASAVACGVAALIHGERFWDGLMDGVHWLGHFFPWS